MKGMIDRTNESGGDCVLVTGSIGPQFEPKLFRDKPQAVAYAKAILAHGKAHAVYPAFSVVLERRHRTDMQRMQVTA